ncbi:MULTISPECIES: acetoacetate decarboxylase family protein [unclassified Nodularia (in: cyanobacteria)]|uniref:acetoacetate decarboxylase family protein n=1 Tax=unclassified Nodularia (in: cyanobacteria) TaxID=2656917 RepID=UPI00187EFA89|nr:MULTISPECIES: acetoacetate decarboxylase family protein [unclassified Nodularia (in: cyanobacteria)]MBE9199890.1 acetoacetate decarboxylase family protein [Nodularia sp. LEGE 06071]MCC2692284.1 acetoacetate decarboxylase family protein [Nodularia sp. LEGE 04288]
MSYPSAPWILKGDAIQTLHLVNIDQVRSLVPPELNIISVWPGKTFGGLYLSKYGSGSVLEYSELIFAPAVVIYQGKIGVWVSHIYVDHGDSVAGGREIWGLPKELANFSWKGKGVIVRQGDSLLCTLNYDQQNLAWRQRLGAASFSKIGTNLLIFNFKFEGRLGLVGSKLEIAAESPFAGLGLTQPLVTVGCEQMTLRVDAPKVVGQRTA